VFHDYLRPAFAVDAGGVCEVAVGHYQMAAAAAAAAAASPAAGHHGAAAAPRTLGDAAEALAEMETGWRGREKELARHA